MDDRFFSQYLKNCHNKKPEAWRKPFVFPFDEQELWLGLKSIATLAKQGGFDRNFTMTTGQENRPTSDMRLLPHQLDLDLNAYIRRIKATLRQEPFFISVNGFERSSSRLWFWCRDFVMSLARSLGEKPQSWYLGAFIGDPKVSPYGVHCDPFSNFTFVIKGPKKMRIWPRAALESDFPGLGRRANPGLLNYKKYMHRSILLKGESGDLFYWPDSYWHVGEGADQVTATVVLGIDWQIDETTVAKRVFESTLLQSKNRSNTIRTHYKYKDVTSKTRPCGEFDAVRRLLQNSQFGKTYSQNTQLAWLMWKSSFGCTNPISSRGKFRFSAKSSLKLIAQEFLFVFKTKDRLVIAVNGHQKLFKKSKETLKLLDLLNAGAAVELSKLLAIGRKDPEETTTLINWLYSVWALEDAAERT